jgi:Flp pilus assembly pilin Flp
MFKRFSMPKILAERRAVSSLEYALVAAALALVLFEVMQAPAHALGEAINTLFAGPGGRSSGG